MNALTTMVAAPVDGGTLTLALPDDLHYPGWLEVGRGLAASKRNMDWLIGDWVGFGREHFPEQIALDLPMLAEAAGDHASLKRIEKTVAAFPSHMRDASLSFEHHANVADLPGEDRLDLLRKAHAEKLSAKQIKVEATMRRISNGQQAMWKDEDIDYTELMSIVRAWNSARPHIREQFLDLAAPAKTGIIEA